MVRAASCRQRDAENIRADRYHLAYRASVNPGLESRLQGGKTPATPFRGQELLMLGASSCRD